MLPALALLVGAALGFVGSRKLRGSGRSEPVAASPRAVAAAAAPRSVGGPLRRRTLTGPELQRACFSEMVRHVRVNRQGRTHAPSRYLLRLHPDDLAVVQENQRWFTQGLADALRRAAATNGWQLDGEVEVTYEVDPSRHVGAPGALAVSPDDPASSPPSAAPPAPTTAQTGARQVLVLVRADTGEQVPLDASVVTIGRSRDRTIMIDDNRVSRAHATIGPSGGGWVVTDQGSSNGTRVGGQELAPNQPRPLRAGDVIGVGPVDLRVAARAGVDAAEPGTRALDDSTRTRISAEVLPPQREPGR